MTEGTVWVTGGCSSYYIDRNGHNSTLWPTFTWPFRQRTREFDEAAYTWMTRCENRPGNARGPADRAGPRRDLDLFANLTGRERAFYLSPRLTRVQNPQRGS